MRNVRPATVMPRLRLTVVLVALALSAFALVARAFVRSRRLWLLDEPFDGLDADARQRFRARLDGAVSRGATVVMATHHEEDVPGYVTRVLTLRRGRAPVSTNR